MNKREFMAGTLAGIGGSILHGGAFGKTKGGESGLISDAGVTFSWTHDSDRLRCMISAPTRGWIAAGFNETSGLRGTRFVMAAVSIRPMRVSERIALVPDHREITAHGGVPALRDADGSYEEGRSRLSFSLPHKFEDRPALSLRPGSHAHLMLAWSHETEFDHHSAWRRHFPITL